MESWNVPWFKEFFSFFVLKAIGRPHFPPYWSLGYQLSRWGYTDIDTVKKIVRRMEQYGIPQVSVHFGTYISISIPNNKKDYQEV